MSYMAWVWSNIPRERVVLVWPARGLVWFAPIKRGKLLRKRWFERKMQQPIKVEFP